MWWVGFAKIHCKRHYKITLQKTLQNELTKDAAQRLQKDTEKDGRGLPPAGGGGPEGGGAAAAARHRAGGAPRYPGAH